jgi:hypothetical protein
MTDVSPTLTTSVLSEMQDVRLLHSSSCTAYIELSTLRYASTISFRHRKISARQRDALITLSFLASEYAHIVRHRYRTEPLTIEILLVQYTNSSARTVRCSRANYHLESHDRDNKSTSAMLGIVNHLGANFLCRNSALFLYQTNELVPVFFPPRHRQSCIYRHR